MRRSLHRRRLTLTEPSPYRVLFVCTGNTCRSPLAEVIGGRVAGELALDLDVASAGVAAYPGSPASEGSLRAARRHGLELDDHRARLLTPELVESSDLILTMSAGHLAQVEALGGGDKGWVITDFAQVDGLDGGVPDPFGGDDAVYEEAYRALESLVTESLQRLLPRPAR